MKRLSVIIIFYITLVSSISSILGEQGVVNLESFIVKDGQGDDFPLSKYKKVPAVLIVNVASYCGYTDAHYRELQALRTKYDESKLGIVAFPCNQFGAQEPGTWEEIVSFVDQHYGVTFPVMGKVDVNGHQSDPLFAWLKMASGIPVDIPWNFSKFLVICGDVKRFSHDVSVMQLEHAIKNAPDSCPDLTGEL